MLSFAVRNLRLGHGEGERKNGGGCSGGGLASSDCFRGGGGDGFDAGGWAVLVAVAGRGRLEGYHAEG